MLSFASFLEGLHNFYYSLLYFNFRASTALSSSDYSNKKIMASKPVSAPSPAQGVGPLYRPDGEKPTATVSKEVSYDNVHVLPQTPQLIALLT